MPSPPKSSSSGSSGGPSIRLSVPSRSTTLPLGSAATSSTGSGSSAAAKNNSSSKKRRFEPPSSARSNLNTSQAYNVQLLHQKSTLSFVLHRDSPTTVEPTWHAQGITTLYVLEGSSSSASDNVSCDTTKSPLSLALHMRGPCQVTSVDMESPRAQKFKNKNTNNSPVVMAPCGGSGAKSSSSFVHMDPLERVLLKPPTSFTMDDVISKTKRHQADSQCSRGAIGMTNAIRVASVASNMGELRLDTLYSKPHSTTVTTEQLQACWKQDLLKPIAGGETVLRLGEQMESRCAQRRAARMQLVAKTLASSKQQKALKITVRYTLCLGGENANTIMNNPHFGGIHAVTSHQTPHVYTTSGVYGDHEGPRSWIPTLDSASTKHRASHDLTIKVTAPMKEGLSVVGLGEDFGVQETMLHDRVMVPTEESDAPIRQELGADHMALVHRISTAETPDDPKVHVIPPESNQITTINSILATSVWVSGSCLPIPARSLGFAIGPFRILEDPEYFSEMDEDDMSPLAEEVREALEAARENGEGIRQAYFAPGFARKQIHATTANTKLIPNTHFQITPLTPRQVELSEGLDQSVLTATVGVPHRALSLMRDILAVPAFRSVSYTQIWIPHAVHGGATSGALHCCPEVLINPFLGGSIMDARLLPPMGHRLPYHQGGRVSQFLQARNAIRAWTISAIPLGGRDDVGQGYIHTLIETLMMSLYERGHGAHGEGGSKGGVFFTKRFSSGSGLNNSNLDFLPVQNIEDTDLDVVVGGVIGAVPVEDRNNEQLWRSASNGTESHTSSMDEFSVRQLLLMDSVNALERGTEKDRFVPTPSMGWMGSHLSLSFLSSNANSSSDLGCGALELVHPTGGLPYRALKGDLLRKVVQGRAGIANLVRLVRAAFVAAHLDDNGQKELKYPPEKKTKVTDKEKGGAGGEKLTDKDEVVRPKPRFIVCVNELLKKKGLTHTLFTRALQNLAGRIREAQLLGTLVDVERDSKDPRTNRPFVDPEGFPNSFVRGASAVHLRVGVQVEPAKDAATGLIKGIQLQTYAEPVIPEGGISYGGPITVRVVENEGQLREFVKDVNSDGSRRDWGSLFLHAKPVTSPKDQTDASGIIESSNVKDSKASSSGNGNKDSSSQTLLGGARSGQGAFSESNIHRGGYQAIELIRLTNLTPLLWLRVDPMGLYGGRMSVFQPDACLAEMLFHDGDAGAQVDSLRALAERPLRIQGSVKVTSIFDVKVSELPVRLLGDCLRGSPALFDNLPHTPAVRAQAALAIAQWQNNKAPSTRNALGSNHWVGIDLLIQYFRERFYNNGTVMPVKFNRVMVKNNGIEGSRAAATDDVATPNTGTDDSYNYLDSYKEGAERAAILEEADEIEVEEDEEYRVRSAVITAVASIRAKDGMTPSSAVSFLETVLEAVDAEMVGNLVSPDEEVILEKKRRKIAEAKADSEKDSPEDDLNDGVVASLPFVSSMLVADALLALCHINISPSFITDPSTGKPVQSTANHPVEKLMGIARRWLEWELYREGIRAEIELESQTGVSGEYYDTIAACAITALSSLAILRQSTTDPQAVANKKAASSQEDYEADTQERKRLAKLGEAATAPFYMAIFDSKPHRSDVTRAACAQAIMCVCCAADRFESESQKPVGLLTALKFTLERIVDPSTSPGLRQTLAQLMLDACSGKICAMQRVGAIGGRNDLVTSATRFLNGPLGASNGGDNGSAAVSSVNPVSYPAANAVNDGARRGLRLMSRAGHPRETGVSEKLVVRIAVFATNLWRTINGEPLTLKESIRGRFNGDIGVCASDGHLRCTLLALWQWVWPRGCFGVMQVQAWKSHEGTQHYKSIGAHRVMKISNEEKEAATAEENSLVEISRLVDSEIDRQLWRGEMATKAYEYFKSGKSGIVTDASAAEQGIGQPLPPIQRDNSFKAGGWIASAAQQRRALALDGGTAVTKLRLRKSGD